MKTVLIFAGLVAFALAGTVPQKYDFELKDVDETFVLYQKKIFGLYYQVTQELPEAEYYKIGSKYDIESHFDMYTDKKVVEEFLQYYKDGMISKYEIFSVFNDNWKNEAMALYKLFYSAKDFETFYKTACWARVYLNGGLFTYSFTIALKQRQDTKDFVIPAAYEIYPFFFVNSEVISKLYNLKMQDGLINPKAAQTYGITYEDELYHVYANYSGWYTQYNKEQKLSYFTEDVGLNAFYYHFHTHLPFWMSGEQFGPIKERRGEYFFYFYQQILARYYMERLTNGLGEIPTFSWDSTVEEGYYPSMFHHSMVPFYQRNNYYTFESSSDKKFLEMYENQFLQFLQQGHFKAYNWEVDFRNSKAINFVGNYWQSSADLFEKFGPKNYELLYNTVAHLVLGGAAGSGMPSALEHYETALRDPVFYQFYKHVLYFALQYKQYLEPYTREQLDFVGVKINDVKVDQLVTYFDFFDFEGSHGVFYNQEELKNIPSAFRIRQPRLNHKSFNVEIDVKSDVSTDAIVKIFLAPKYNSEGFELDLEDNWMNFFELDMFKYKLVPGKNTIVRKSEDFFYFEEDSVPTVELYKFLESHKIPVHMKSDNNDLPERLMLPKGTKDGFPFQFFVVVYPYTPLDKQYSSYEYEILDNKPFGYPFDRPAHNIYFKQPNMYFKDVSIYHEGEDYYYKMNYPGYHFQKNEIAH